MSAPTPPLTLGLFNTLSQNYRNISDEMFKSAKTVLDGHAYQATQYAEDNHVSFDDAMEKMVGKNYNKLKWEAVRIQGYDSNVGDQITSSYMEIHCNSVVVKGLYNDTVCIAKKGEEFESVTYTEQKSSLMTHSGDIRDGYGLCHVVNFKDGFEEGFVISTPWVNTQPRLVSELNKTEFILEICAQDGDDLKRYIIPQDFSDCGDNTACVNTKIVYKDGKYTATIMRKYTMGFANDTIKLIEGVQHL